MSSSISSWQILTAHAQPFRGAGDGRALAFCLKVPLDSLLVWASSGGSGETARTRSLAWTFAARIGDKYQIRLTRGPYHYTLRHSFNRNYSRVEMCMCRAFRSGQVFQPTFTLNRVNSKKKKPTNLPVDFNRGFTCIRRYIGERKMKKILE